MRQVSLEKGSTLFLRGEKSEWMGFTVLPTTIGDDRLLSGVKLSVVYLLQLGL